MHPLNGRAREALDRLVEAFDDPSAIVDTVVQAVLLPPGSPCRKWSLCNRLILALAGVDDARGYGQWREMGRHVQQGARALWILAPRIRKTVGPDADQEEQVLLGYFAVPVFSVGDTDGAPLPTYEPQSLPRLSRIAEAVGVPLSYAGSIDRTTLGAYLHSPGDEYGVTGRIVLHSHQEGVLAHELGHALAHRCGVLQRADSPEDKVVNEVIAELTAAVLVHLYEGQETGRQALEYVRRFTASKPRVLTIVPKVLRIVDFAIEVGLKPAACDAQPQAIPVAV